MRIQHDAHPIFNELNQTSAAGAQDKKVKERRNMFAVPMK
jgi:hypothetical protein